MLSSSDFSFKQILFLVTKDGEKLSFKNDNIVIKDKDGKIIHQSTCYRLFAIFIVGDISVTSGLIKRAKKFGFAIILMTTSYRPYQSINSFAEANVVLRRKQYAYSELNAAKRITANKIENQLYLLKQMRNKGQDIKDAIKFISQSLMHLDELDSIQRIMGIEGSVSRVYFKAYFDNVEWKGRKPRIKFDMVNALLDIGYTILFGYIDAVLSVFGFDRYCGVLHREFYMRKSLVCDIVEPFRVIIDRQVKKGINLEQFQEKDFEVFSNKWCLKYKKNAAYGAVFIDAILDYKTEIFVYVREFYRSFMRDNLDTTFPTWKLGG